MTALIHHAANGVGFARTSGMPGRRPLHQHGGKRYTMNSSIPTIDMESFGTYPAYLAALLDDLKTTLGLSQFEVCGKDANFVQGDGEGDESVEIGPIGNIVNLNVGALRESPVELWGNGTWIENSAVATCPLDVHTAKKLLVSGDARITIMANKTGHICG